MPRTARVSLAGGLFHVVSRFAREENALDGRGARQAYLAAIERAAEPDDAQVLAYCLMSNHVHLVMVQGTAPLSRFMKSVHTAFARYVNRGRRRSAAQGAVFAGRPRMVLVDRDAYLLELVRYVHNNPVRAGVVRFARNSPWSSHRAYIGASEAPAWLRMGYVLERFGRTGAREKFAAFVDRGRKEPRRPELSGAQDAGEAAMVRRSLGDGHRRSDGVLGGTRFVERVIRDQERVRAALAARGTERRTGPIARPSLREVANAVLELLDLDGLDLEQRPKARDCTHAKRLITWLWVHEYGGQQIDVARMLELETGAVSRHYRYALALAGEFDEQATAVVALLRGRAKRRPRSKTRATADALGVRYFVDVDET
jgi:REP element-mobilizing transposase RayT